MAKRVIITSGILLLYICVWIILHVSMNILAIGPNPVFQFSPNYKIIRGDMLYTKSGDEPLDYRQSFLFKEPVDAFYVKNEWLLGKSGGKYFAINMKTQKTDYPINSLQELNEISGLNVKSINWFDEQEEKINSPYLVPNKTIQKAKKVIDIVCTIALPFLSVILIIWIIKNRGGKRHQESFSV
ncbi:MAG: hypothetical protein JXA82_01250 [Sedimentisphaerales bacterium]|nr:hypothetical protein [Sedimentisphaerales bacterium]